MEVKNLNSFQNLKDSLVWEVERQSQQLGERWSIPNETRLYDGTERLTFLTRRKEVDEDYRYFPEPDLTTIPAGCQPFSDLDGSCLLMLHWSLTERYLGISLGLNRTYLASLIVGARVPLFYWRLGALLSLRVTSLLFGFLVAVIRSCCRFLAENLVYALKVSSRPEVTAKGQPVGGEGRCPVRWSLLFGVRVSGIGWLEHFWASVVLSVRWTPSQLEVGVRGRERGVEEGEVERKGKGFLGEGRGVERKGVGLVLLGR